MSFKGERRNYLSVARGRKRPVFAPLKRNYLTVPGVPGSRLKSTDIDSRPLDIPVRIRANNMEELQKVKEDLAAWLYSEKEEPLIIDDEPDRIYYAVVDGQLDLDELVNRGKGTISFLARPFKYSTVSKYQHSSVFDDLSLLTVKNQGTVETYPTFEIQADKEYTYIDVTNGDQVNRIGRIVNIEEYARKREELILNDKLTTTVSWVKTEGFVRIDGLATGTMKSDGYRFIAENFGTMTDGWHGPFYKKSLGQELTDFQLEAFLELINTGEDKFGKVEVYLLDADNLPVCMLSLKDVDSAGKRIYATVRMGGGDVAYKDIISTHGEKEHTFWNFYGILRVKKVGNQWEAYVSTIDKQTGKHTARTFKAYSDDEQQFTRKPTQIGIYIAQYGSRSAASMRADDVRVYKINSLTENQIPYIVQAGDIITFNHEEELVLINGEDRTDLLAFGGEFFPLARGDNMIAGSPPLPIKAMWRERFR